MKKKKFPYLLLIFLGILAIKIPLGLLFNGPTIFPDEACIIETAKAFAKIFQIIDCSEITNAPHGTPPFLVPIILSIFYLFLPAIKAYKAILIFHALLVSSLIFPLYKIFKKFIQNDLWIYIGTGLFLFIPQLFMYEKTLMTETLFAVTNIWFLYFYLESFEKNKTRNTIISALLAIAATFLRPFGFIVLFSLLINEFIQSKKKKTATLITIPLLIITTVSIFLTRPELTAIFYSKILSLGNIDNLSVLAKGVINQFNSLNVATLSVPLIVFISYFNDEDLKVFRKIKYYILTFIVVNMLISVQHMYGYFMELGEQPDLIFRYINVSILYVLIFGIIFILKYKDFKLNKKNLIISAVVLLPLLLVDDHFYTAPLILEYVHIKQIESFFSTYYIFIAMGLFLLLINNKQKTVIATMFIVLLTHSTLGFLLLRTNSHNVHVENPVYQIFKNKQNNILYIMDLNIKNLSTTYWSILNLTDNHVESGFYDSKKLDNESKKINTLYSLKEGENKPLKIAPKVKEFDYVITNLDLNLPIYHEGAYSKVYEVPSN